MPVRNYNFDAQSHKQLHDKIHRSTGAGTADATNNAWLSFRAAMGNAKSNVESAVRDAKAVWSGAANESFSSGMAPLVQWAESACAAGQESHNAFLAQRSHYIGTRDRMPDPVEVTSTANDDYLGIPAGFTHLVGGQTDQDIEEQRANEAKREAVRMMNVYQSGAVEAVSSVGTFTPPPTVTLDVPAPAVEQSPEQRQHEREFNARLNTADTGNTGTPSSSMPSTSDVAVPPPTFQQSDQGTTHLSDAGTPPMTRPDLLPTPNPTPPPTPPGSSQFPPGTGLPLSGQRGSSTGHGGSGSSPTGRGRSSGSGSPTSSGVPGSFGTGRGSPRTGGPSLPGQQPGNQLGRAPSPGMGDGHVAGRPGAAGPGIKGGAGAAGASMAGSPQQGQGDEDIEHRSAEYLQELDDLWGEDDVLVAPPVIGDDLQ